MNVEKDAKGEQARTPAKKKLACTVKAFIKPLRRSEINEFTAYVI